MPSLSIDLLAWLDGGTISNVFNRLILPGASKRWAKIIELESYPFDLGVHSKDTRLDIKLGQSLTLVKEFRVASSARKKLSQIVDLHMRQSSPGEAKDLTWAYEAKSTSDNQLLITIFIVKTALLDQIQSLSGAQIRTISVANSETARPLIDKRNISDRPLQIWNGIAFLLILIIFAIAALQQTVELRSLKDLQAELLAQKNELISQIANKQDQQSRFDEQLQVVQEDLDVFNQDTERLIKLLELTSAFSDNVWVSNLSLNANSIRLSTFTKDDVAETMQQIKELPWVASIELDGPVTFDSYSRASRAEFLVTIVKKADLPS
ncbi:PilN domain-containing protein [Aliiroseovarius crassostreae]|uniref:PilN domain-containing protein n=1 Tax=Aliiroseovarius crassostreae TaxID=154981 RepID=A0A9Q9LVS4_9RHOB|nr:PilN domain-containing protein [Aliiroseovarius crassostreae]UWP96196.1 PilN domain-containing protein [Aliiroseovarius crassostreae]